MRTPPDAGRPATDGGQVGIGRTDRDGRPDAGDLLARVRDLRLYFDTDHGTVKALEGIDFDLYTGEIFALVGETGCGKSITARSFMQLVPSPPGRYPSGEILMRTGRPCPDCGGGGCDRCFGIGRGFENLLGVSSAQMDRIRGDRIAMIFQDPEETMNPSLTIKSHMAEAILAHRTEAILDEAGIELGELDPTTRWLVRDRASADRSPWLSLASSVPPVRRYKRRIDRVVERQSLELLGEVQLPNPTATLSAYPHELSGGQLQRVMIAMALGARPDLLIADEATTALDVTTQANILELVGDLQDEYDTGILYITHDLTLVRDIADRVGVMYAGNMAEIGGIDRVYRNPLHPYTRGLLDSIPSDDRVGTRLEGIGGSIPDLTDPPTGCRFATRCPEVMDHCWDVVPETEEPEPDHQVDCHLYTDQGPAAEPTGGEP